MPRLPPSGESECPAPFTASCTRRPPPASPRAPSASARRCRLRPPEGTPATRTADNVRALVESGSHCRGTAWTCPSVLRLSESQPGARLPLSTKGEAGEVLLLAGGQGRTSIWGRTGHSSECWVLRPSRLMRNAQSHHLGGVSSAAELPVRAHLAQRELPEERPQASCIVCTGGHGGLELLRRRGQAEGAPWGPVPGLCERGQAPRPTAEILGLCLGLGLWLCGQVRSFLCSPKGPGDTESPLGAPGEGGGLTRCMGSCPASLCPAWEPEGCVPSPPHFLSGEAWPCPTLGLSVPFPCDSGPPVTKD